jgi:RNA-binding protein YlmH
MNNKYYFFIIDSIYDLIIRDLHSISNNIIKLQEVNLDILDNYQRQYEEINIIVSSLRIDTVISRIINTNRNIIKDKIKNKEIIINYNILTNNSYTLKENDIFSIRKYGKYKYLGIIKNTKKDNYIIKLNKYI